MRGPYPKEKRSSSRFSPKILAMGNLSNSENQFFFLVIQLTNSYPINPCNSNNIPTLLEFEWIVMKTRNIIKLHHLLIYIYIANFFFVFVFIFSNSIYIVNLVDI
jgi:hypothetical protein